MYPHPPRSTLFPYTTLFRSVAFDGKDVTQLSIIRLGPELRASLRVNQVNIDPDLIACFLHATLEDVHYAKLLRDLSKIARFRSEEHTSELQSRFDLVCRLLL